MREEVLYKAILNLRKSYDALDWDCCVEIFVGYDIRPRMARFLYIYWDHLLIVAQAGQYYGAPF